MVGRASILRNLQCMGECEDESHRPVKLKMSLVTVRGTAMYCTVLYCTVLYCTVLYCTVLYCTVLYCTVLYCTVLYCSIV